MSTKAYGARRCWKNFKGSWIPYEIMILRDISPTEMLIMALIHAYDNSAKPEPNNNPCYLENGDFSEMLNVSIRTINSAVLRLKVLGLIEIYTNKSEGNERFLYSMMTVEPRGRKLVTPYAKIAQPPNAKSALPSSKDCITPCANSALHNIEVNTGGSTEREREDFPLPPEGVYSEKSKEGRAVTAYRMAVEESRAMSAEFLAFFYDVIFKRFNKWVLNSTDLEDWYENIWQKYEPDQIEPVIKDHRTHLSAKVWKPDMKHVRIQLRENKARAESANRIVVEKREAELQDPSVIEIDVWIKDAEDNPAEFVRRYETESFYREMVDRKPERKEAYRKAKAVAAKEDVA